MKFTYLTTIACLVMTTTVLASEMDYFIAPSPNSHYKSGDTISFLVEDMPDEDDQNINANLHKSDGSFIKTIQTWSSQNVDESGEEFPFQWLVDVTEGGEYYVEIRVGASRDDATQSYPFTIEVDGESSAEADATVTDPADSANAPIVDDTQSATGTDDLSAAYDQEEIQEQPDEPEEKAEPAKNKLSLHNQQSKVAHISSHNDIDTVSDPAPSATEKTANDDHSSQQKHDKSKEIVTSEKSSNIGNVAAALTSKLRIGHKNAIGPANLDISKLAVGTSKGKTEPLMPQIKPHASMKDLVAADEIAIAQEKKWIAEQQKGSSSDDDDDTAKKPSHADKKKGKHVAATTTSHSTKGKSQKPKVETKKIAQDDKPKSEGLASKIKSNVKATVDKVKEQAKAANDKDKDQKKLTLAQQEALDDAAAKKELESIKKSQTGADKPSKEKRDAYRQVMRNRAKFAKQSLQ